MHLQTLEVFDSIDFSSFWKFILKMSQIILSWYPLNRQNDDPPIRASSKVYVTYK